MRPSAPKELELAAIMQRLAPDFDPSDVERFAHSLAVAAVLAKAGEGALRGRKGKNRELIEMRQLNERALALLRHMGDLDPLSAFVLKRELTKVGRDIRQAMENLCALANASVSAHAVISEQPYRSSRAGRPGKSAGKAIAREAGQYFEALTGKPPGRAVRDGRPCGAFPQFLEEIFDVLGIDASVDDCAKAVVMEKSVTFSD